jgi:hypothetical protein
MARPPSSSFSFSLPSSRLSRALVPGLAALALFPLGCSPGDATHSSTRLSIATRSSRLGPCNVEVSRVNVDQVGIDDGSRELIELFVPDGVGKPLSACGVWRVGSYEGGGSTPVCAPEATSRFANVADVVVPDDGFVLITRGGATTLGVEPDATTSQTKGPWLENGPDYLVLEGEHGPIFALQVGSAPTCALPPLPADASGGGTSPDDLPGAVPIVVLPKEGDTSGEERILVSCDDGFRPVPLAASPPHTDRTAACATAPPAASTMPTAVPTTTVSTTPPPPGVPTATAPPVPTTPPSSPTTTTPPPPPPPPPCRVRFSKVDVAQPATALHATKDSRETVELFVEGAIPDGATLASCGVTTFAPYRAGSKTEVSLCGSTAGSYGEVAIGHLLVPFPPYLLLAQRPDADSPLSVSKTSALLSNGPDYLTLRAEDGTIVDAVSYPAPAAPGYYPDCPGFEAAALLPACEDSSKKGIPNTLALRCEDGSWMEFPDTEVSYRAPAPAPCGPAPAATNESAGGAGEDLGEPAAVDGGAGGSGGSSGLEGEGAGAGAAGQSSATAGGGGQTARPPLPASEGGAGTTATATAPSRLPLRENACSTSRPGGAPQGSGGGFVLELVALWLGAVGRSRGSRRSHRRVLRPVEREQKLAERDDSIGFVGKKQVT